MKKQLLVLHFLSACFLLFAQQEQHFFRTLDTDDGLPHNFIIDILEDRDGLMWISTPAGLSKYNGQAFTTYAPHVRDSTVKEDRLPFIWDLFEDDQGQIWLGADNGLFAFDKRTGTAECFKGFGKKTIDWENYSTKSCYQTADGTLYASTDQGILQINWQNSTTFLAKHPSKLQGVFPDQNMQGNTWSANMYGLYLFQPNQDLSYFPIVDNPEICPKVFCFHIDTTNNFWLGTDDGLYNFNAATQIYTKIEIPGFGQISITDIVEIEHGVFYIATQDHGVLHWNAITKQLLEHHKFSAGSTKGLPSTFLFCLSLSKDKSLWIGTDEGISLFRPNNSQFRFYAHPGEKRNPANSRNVLTLDRADHLWFFYLSENNLYQQKSLTDSLQKVQLDRSAFPNSFKYIFEDSQGQIWFTSRSIGLFFVNPQSLEGRLVKDISYFYNYAIKQAVVDPINEQYFWIATDGGLCHFNSVTHDTSWVRPTQLDSTAAEDFVSKLILSKDSTLWFMNTSRLCSYEQTTQSFFCYPILDKQTKEKIALKYLSDIVWADDQLYLAFREGFLIFDDTEKEFTFLQSYQGYDLRNLSNPIVDNEGNVWMVGDQQLIRYTPQTEAFSFYSTEEFCNKFLNFSTGKFSDGRLLFATKCGLLVVDPSIESPQAFAPRVVLSSFLVRNQPYNLSEAPEFVAQIELPYQDNFFTINYTALEYLNPENISYRYKLEGLNEDWVNAGHDRSVNFANLAPGRYTFLAEAILPDGTQSSAPFRLPIVIKPAYWQTIGFKVLIAACLLAILLIIFRVRQKAQQLAADKRLAEQNSLYKSKFLANVSHEIRTPLNAILGINSLLMESTNLDSKQKHFTESIHLSCEKLLAIINDLLDQAKIESGKFSLNPQPFELRQLIHQIERLLEHKFSEKGLLLHTGIADEVPNILVGDAIRLFQILMNLTGNALKFTEVGTVRIQVNTLSQEEDNCLLQFAVIDTGVGIPAEKLNDVFKSFEQLGNNQPTSYSEKGTGLGLSIAKELIELQGGQITLTSIVGQGTTFLFSLSFQIGEEIAAAIQPSSPQVFPSGLKVLIVDDTPINQFLTAELLKKHLPDVHTETAANGEVALNKITNERYDLVLMDVRMPVMGGMEATQRVRSKPDSYYQSLPILGLTSDAIPQQIEACRQAGMNDCLSKPVRTADLVAMIKKYL
jgi:signal transduction histidine kinase/ligand-binding sensor domain-containing protein